MKFALGVFAGVGAWWAAAMVWDRRRNRGAPLGPRVAMPCLDGQGLVQIHRVRGSVH